MAKAKKRKKSNRKGSLSNVPPELLVADGNKFLASGNFVKAVEVFKYLLKNEPCQQWQEQLAKAYLGRAKGLYAKKMAKEALAILDNMAHFCPEATPEESLIVFKIELLIEVARLEKAADLYCHEAKNIKGTAVGKALEELFAALCLAEEGTILKALPEKSTIVSHYHFAREALRAYCQQEDAEALQQLKQIPSRSPYKHFVLAIKGLLLLSSDQTAASRILAKVPQSSPFYALIGAVACIQSDQHFVIGLAEMKRTELQLLACIMGFDEKRLAILTALFRAQKQPQKQIALLCSQGKEVDTEWAKQTCQHLLPLHPRGENSYTKVFGYLSKQELCRLQALAFEACHGWAHALDCWQMYVEGLTKTPESSKKDLSLALIYRHMAEIVSKQFDSTGAEYSDFLEKSLYHDPLDKPTYQKLFDAYRDDKKTLRKWLDLALENFPEDIDILIKAAEVALDSKSFKKTSRYAERILQLDPINTRVRELLLWAHLAHGCKLAKTGKFDLAGKEFVLAGSQQRTDLHKGTALICQGLLKVLEKEEEEGHNLIATGQQLVGLSCQAWLITAVEAALMELPQGQRNRINRQFKACKQTDLNKAEFYRLLEQVKTYQQQEPEVIMKMTGPLQPLFKKSADLNFTQEESRSLCDNFYRQRRFDLLQPFATVAEKRWPDKLIYAFYRLYAKVGGMPENLRKKDCKVLEQLKDKVIMQDDFFLANLIEEFLDYFPFAPPFNAGGSPDFDPDKDYPEKLREEDFADFIEELCEEGLDELFPFKKPKAKKVQKKKKRDQTDPLEQLELF